MLAVSDFVRVYGWLVTLLVGVAGFFSLASCLEKLEIKMCWHQWLLTAPLFMVSCCSLQTRLRLPARWRLRTGSGVPILRALQTSRRPYRMSAVRAQVEDDGKCS